MNYGAAFLAPLRKAQVPQLNNSPPREDPAVPATAEVGQASAWPWVGRWVSGPLPPSARRGGRLGRPRLLGKCLAGPNTAVRRGVQGRKSIKPPPPRASPWIPDNPPTCHPVTSRAGAWPGSSALKAQFSLHMQVPAGAANVTHEPFTANTVINRTP